MANHTLASEGSIANKCVPLRPSINENYHLIDADPINESYRAGPLSLDRLGTTDILSLAAADNMEFFHRFGSDIPRIASKKPLVTLEDVTELLFVS